MHCYICDCEDDLISFDSTTQAFGPCGTCQAIIDDTVADFEEKDEPEDVT